MDGQFGRCPLINFVITFYDFCICCWKVMTINSAGREIATFILIFITPSSTSTGVMVTPRPTSTEKASWGTAPTRAPVFHWLVRKFSNIPLMLTQVLVEKLDINSSH